MWIINLCLLVWMSNLTDLPQILNVKLSRTREIFLVCFKHSELFEYTVLFKLYYLL